MVLKTSFLDIFKHKSIKSNITCYLKNKNVLNFILTYFKKYSSYKIYFKKGSIKKWKRKIKKLENLLKKKI